MPSTAVLVLDCGATNVRALAVSAGGEILAARSVPNAPSPDPEVPGGKIWDHERIWRDFSDCARGVIAELGGRRIGALTVTTFGVDGTLVDQGGAPLHPVISWQCGRTAATDKHFQEELHLTLAQSAWVQFVHYLGYFLMSLPAGWLATRLGYKAKQASAFIVMAIIGGALLPKLRSLRHVEGLRRPHGLLRLGGCLCVELAAPEQDRIFGPPRRHRWAWPVDQVEDEPWSNSI